MLTIFSTPKPFLGHSNIIQRNALKSWTLLHPDVDVILFGDDDGAAAVCEEFGIRHEPQVRRNERGTKYLNYLFDRARDMSPHKYLCYVNCDIMLTPDFLQALEIVTKAHDRFLMVGRRWDTDITEPWDFSQPDWAERLRSLALQKGKQNGPSWVDYFCFPRDFYYGKMPPFLIGRHGWDPWLAWYARETDALLVDASRMVVAVHQNHDYAYLGKGQVAQLSKAEVDYNLSFGHSSVWRYYGAQAATEKLVHGHLRKKYLAWFGPVKTRASIYMHRVWWACLNVTRPIRQRLGLRSAMSRQ